MPITTTKRIMETDGLYEVELTETKRTKIADDPDVYYTIYNHISGSFPDASQDSLKLIVENIIADLKTAGKLT